VPVQRGSTKPGRRGSALPAVAVPERVLLGVHLAVEVAKRERKRVALAVGVAVLQRQRVGLTERVSQLLAVSQFEHVAVLVAVLVDQPERESKLQPERVGKRESVPFAQRESVPFAVGVAVQQRERVRVALV